MTRVMIILLVLGVVVGVIYALTTQAPPSRDGLEGTGISGPPVGPREPGRSTLSHGGPPRSDAAAIPPALEDRRGAEDGGGRRER